MTPLTLTPPQPVAPVAPGTSASMVPLDPAALPDLDQTAGAYVDRVVSLDPDSAEFDRTSESIRTMGDDDIRSAAEVSNRMLQRPVQALRNGGFDEGEKVSRSLV
ncbi:MAG TPA: toxic anion resistance protein, partial [Acidimicrobiia bacterium]|nr:toxic anion resistance protein [Acidimicrobiia bacterium]